MVGSGADWAETAPDMSRKPTITKAVRIFLVFIDDASFVFK